MNYDINYDVFLSYRRDGGETMAILLRDRLTAKGYRVFLDVEALRAGKFNEKLLHVIENCKDFIIVLSPNSLERCVNEDDWVRKEIAHAIAHEKNVVPVLLRGFTWPKTLPEDISDLPSHNGIDASNNMFFDAAIDMLAEKFISAEPITAASKAVPKVPSRDGAYRYEGRAAHTSSPPGEEEGIYSYFPELAELTDREKAKKFVYAAPLIILLAGLIAAVIIFTLMSIYADRAVSFADLLFSNPLNIIDTLQDFGSLLPQPWIIIAIRIFWYVWLAFFIASLFFVGRRLHFKSPPIASNAELIKKEAYFLAKEVGENIRLAKQNHNDKALDGLVYALKKLEEKLSTESDFGHGKNEIISCENNIAQQLRFLREASSSAGNGDLQTNIKEMNTAITNINNLLERRREMKKR